MKLNYFNFIFALFYKFDFIVIVINLLCLSLKKLRLDSQRSKRFYYY